MNAENPATQLDTPAMNHGTCPLALKKSSVPLFFLAE